MDHATVMNLRFMRFEKIMLDTRIEKSNGLIIPRSKAWACFKKPNKTEYSRVWSITFRIDKRLHMKLAGISANPIHELVIKFPKGMGTTVKNKI